MGVIYTPFLGSKLKNVMQNFLDFLGFKFDPSLLTFPQAIYLRQPNSFGTHSTRASH